MAQSDGRPTGDQEVASSIPARSSNILSWNLIMQYFLWLCSSFRWFKKGSCHFLAKELPQILVNRLQNKACPWKMRSGNLTCSIWLDSVDWVVKLKTNHIQATSWPVNTNEIIYFFLVSNLYPNIWTRYVPINQRVPFLNTSTLIQPDNTWACTFCEKRMTCSNFSSSMVNG